MQAKEPASYSSVPDGLSLIYPCTVGVHVWVWNPVTMLCDGKLPAVCELRCVMSLSLEDVAAIGNEP